MKSYQITVSGRRFDVRILSDPRQDRVQVEVNGELLTVEVAAEPAAKEETPIPAPSPAAVSEAAVPMAGAVAAPLPGTIKSIAVRPGQRVDAGDELLVIEAMKMDNVIRASRAGVVGTVYVAEGRQVGHGEPLLDYRE